MDIIFATHNKGKAKEVQSSFLETNFNVKSLFDISCNVEVVEDGETFSDNALKKANEISAITNEIVIADDSGLEIDFLDKKPGVLSARFLGKETPQHIKNSKILEMLSEVPLESRSARFVCAMAVVLKDGTNFVVTETVEGFIAMNPSGTEGFGYDPIFYVPQYNKTMAELPLDVKNKISHRGKALITVKKQLIELFIS